MRAHYLRHLTVAPEYELSGDDLHHLVNVVRIEQGEPLLLLNGEGLMVHTEVVKVSKRELGLRKLNDSFKDSPYDFSLALGMPKREALELSLKEATELGFRTIYLVRSARSQMKFPEEERMEKLLISALEQSNAPWLPVIKCIDWEDLPWKEMDSILLMDSQSESETSFSHRGPGKALLIVGPEGGFCDEELALFRSKRGIQVIHLPTPILRTPTALAVGAGMMIQSLLK